MRRSSFLWGLLLLAPALLALTENRPPSQQPDPADPATRGNGWKGGGKKGAVSAGGQGAVDAGITVLKDGGNAADAAAATILALSVTDSRSFCFGGEVPILYYDAR